MNDLSKKLVSRLKVISLYGLSQSITPIGYLIISFFIIKFKSIELWGSYVEVLIWVNLLLLFVSFGNKDFLLKSFSKDPSKINQFWLTNLSNRFILLFPCFIIIIVLPFFDEFQLSSILWLLFLFVNQSYQVLILYHKDFKFSFAAEAIFNLCILLFVLIKIDTLDLKSFLLITVIANALKTIIYIAFYIKRMKGLKMGFNFLNLKSSLPFFIPLTLGTVRIKIDTYFANSFFNAADLGKYQILISFLTIGHISTTYFVNPYLKNFFRLNDRVIKKIKSQFFVFGFFYGLFFIIIVYLIISKVYLIQFSLENYIVAFTFLIPLLFQMIIVNQIYKHDKQVIVSYVAFIVIILQSTIGYFLVKNQGIDGAILLKALSQWLITILLWFWLKKIKINKYI